MGNFIAYIVEVFSCIAMKPAVGPSKNMPYAIFDPLQSSKPSDRSKDIICYKHRNDPHQLDTVIHKGCDTVWKNFKRTVWR